MVLTLSALALCSITAGVVLLWGYPVALLVAGSLVWGECLLASWASLAVEARKGKA
jgi:cytochrome c-type biogenesis protein CcmH/NrfF